MTATCAIITTAANALVAPIRIRMPVILSPEAEAIWLDTEMPVPAALELLRAYPSQQMETYPVSTLVNVVRNDGPELVRWLG